MPWYRVLQSIDRRIVYAIMFLSVAVPLLFPIGLPISITQPTRDAFNTLVKLPEGAKVWYAVDYSGGVDGELGPMLDALLKYSFTKGHKVYLFAQWSEGGNIASAHAEAIAKEMGKKYGTDYVNLGYRPSPTAVLERSRSSIMEAFNGVDARGQKLDGMPIMQDMTKAKDVDLVIGFVTGSPGLINYISYWYATGEVKTLIGGITAGNTPSYMSRYQAGQIKGYFNGLRGAAELEKLSGFPGAATPGMDAQSMAHLAIIAFLILGNAGYIAAKRVGDTK